MPSFARPLLLPLREQPLSRRVLATRRQGQPREPRAGLKPRTKKHPSPSADAQPRQPAPTLFPPSVGNSPLWFPALLRGHFVLVLHVQEVVKGEGDRPYFVAVADGHPIPAVVSKQHRGRKTEARMLPTVCEGQLHFRSNSPEVTKKERSWLPLVAAGYFP